LRHYNEAPRQHCTGTTKRWEARTSRHSPSHNPPKSVRDLSVLLDNKLQMKQHVNKLVSVCYYHLRRLFQLQSSVTQNVMLHLGTSFIMHRQLQLCSHQPSNVNDRTSTVRSEYRSTSCPWFGSQSHTSRQF